MNIILYVNNSENIVVNKNLNKILELPGILRESTTLLNPSILIEIDNLITYSEIENVIDNDNSDLVYSDYIDILKCNYCYIPEFNRYYYIDNIDIYNNKLFIINLSTDVLMTYKDVFLDMEALVSRNEFIYDLSIEDTKMAYKYGVESQEYTVGGGTFSFNPAVDLGSLNYHISVFRENSSGVFEVNTRPSPNLPVVSSIASGVNGFVDSYGMITVDVNSLADWIISNEAESSYIIGLIAYPFTLIDNGNVSHLILGDEDTGINCYELKNKVSEYLKLAEFNVGDYIGYDDNYLNYEPYTTYQLYLPYYGYIDLKSSDIIGRAIRVYYSIDYPNGIAKINIDNGLYIVKSVTATIGVKIPINRTNNQQLNDEKTQLAIKSTISGIGSIASIGLGVGTSNPFLMASGVAGLTSTAVDIGTKLSMMHERAVTANNTGLEGLFANQNVRLKITRYQTKEPNNYAHYYGKPLNQEVVLGSLSGYTLIQDIHLNNLNATKNEKDELLSLLTSGIIL